MKTFEEKWRERFIRFAQQNHTDHLVSGWSDQGLRRRLAIFKELLTDCGLSCPARVLDLGCGAGTYVRFLAGLGHQVVGFDYSLPSLHRAIAGDPEHAGRYYVGGEAYNVPFRDESFDLVVAIGIFQVLDRPERALDEIVRVLRPQGILVMEFLNAFEPFALARTAGEQFRGRLPRIRTYSIFQAEQWLAQRRFKPIRSAGVYLPPPGFRWMGKLFEQKSLLRVLDAIPGFSVVGAHAYLVMVEKI